MTSIGTLSASTLLCSPNCSLGSTSTKEKNLSMLDKLCLCSMRELLYGVYCTSRVNRIRRVEDLLEIALGFAVGRLLVALEYAYRIESSSTNTIKKSMLSRFKIRRSVYCGLVVVVCLEGGAFIVALPAARDPRLTRTFRAKHQD